MRTVDHADGSDGERTKTGDLPQPVGRTVKIDRKTTAAPTPGYNVIVASRARVREIQTHVMKRVIGVMYDCVRVGIRRSGNIRRERRRRLLVFHGDDVVTTTERVITVTAIIL